MSFFVSRLNFFNIFSMSLVPSFPPSFLLRSLCFLFRHRSSLPSPPPAPFRINNGTTSKHPLVHAMFFVSEQLRRHRRLRSPRPIHRCNGQAQRREDAGRTREVLARGGWGRPAPAYYRSLWFASEIFIFSLSFFSAMVSIDRSVPDERGGGPSAVGITLSSCFFPPPALLYREDDSSVLFENTKLVCERTRTSSKNQPG